MNLLESTINFLFFILVFLQIIIEARKKIQDTNLCLCFIKFNHSKANSVNLICTLKSLRIQLTILTISMLQNSPRIWLINGVFGLQISTFSVKMRLIFLEDVSCSTVLFNIPFFIYPQFDGQEAVNNQSSFDL